MKLERYELMWIEQKRREMLLMILSEENPKMIDLACNLYMELSKALRG